MTLKAGPRFALMADGPLVPHSRACAGNELIAAATRTSSERLNFRAMVAAAVRLNPVALTTLIIITFCEALFCEALAFSVKPWLFETKARTMRNPIHACRCCN